MTLDIKRNSVFHRGHDHSGVPVYVAVWQRIAELEATLYSALQQEPGGRAVAESLSDRQREELGLAVDKLRRQILRQSRQYDSQILQERMELLQHAQQVRKSLNLPPPQSKDAVSLLLVCVCLCFLVFCVFHQTSTFHRSPILILLVFMLLTST